MITKKYILNQIETLEKKHGFTSDKGTNQLKNIKDINIIMDYGIYSNYLDLLINNYN